MIKKKLFKSIIENTKTIFFALLIALFIRSLFIQPFYIPSSSMEPTLLIGDRIFVAKTSYGYSKHSFPFSPNISNKRYFYNQPNQGDLVVFKTPADNRTDYIKRLIGMPGDEIQFVNGSILINGKQLIKKKIEQTTLRCGKFLLKVNTYLETLPNGAQYVAAYKQTGTLMNTKKFIVPEKHFFLLGDNRDCSKDSRYLNSVGYVSYKNLVGKAKVIFFSNDTVKGSLFKFWNIHNSFRLERLFKTIK